MSVLRAGCEDRCEVQVEKSWLRRWLVVVGGDVIVGCCSVDDSTSPSSLCIVGQLPGADQHRSAEQQTVRTLDHERVRTDGTRNEIEAGASTHGD
eukprot:2620292-Rhodomonas_salina.2